MNLYNMLPFLEGWDELSVSKTRTVTKGRYERIFSRECKGWLVGVDFVSDDAYASLRGTYLGRTAIVTPHLVFMLGAIEPPPSGGYCSVYIRPSTLSTAGVFMSSPITSAYVWSIKGLVRLELGLEAESTQATATAAVSFTAIEIVDTEAFIRSVRKFKYGWLGWIFGAISKIPGLRYIGIPKEIKEVVS